MICKKGRPYTQKTRKNYFTRADIELKIGTLYTLGNLFTMCK